MQLTTQSLTNESSLWKKNNYHIPSYDRQAMIEKTKSAPTWIHFGNGNLFKAFQAKVLDTLLEKGITDTGVIVVERTNSAAAKTSRAYEHYVILATLKADGTLEKSVVGSIAQSVIMDPSDKKEYGRLKEIFAAPSLQMASFTITEKGYDLWDEKGDFQPGVQADLASFYTSAQTYMGKMTGLLYERYQTCRKPLAMVSMDNCSGNGQKLKNAIMEFAKEWVKQGQMEEGFLDYLKTDVRFPWSMIDKITPRPGSCVKEILSADGIEDASDEYATPFVNAEETEYLVIEDDFPNGKPPLDQGGIIFTDRETVNNVETMKVTTCLNPLHTALAVFGCLLGYKKIASEMKDEDILKLVQIIGYKEGLPVVVDPKIIHPKDFIDTVLEVRLPNPFMPDSPQRIATDTSMKLCVRFGKTIKSYLNREDLSVEDLKLIPLVFAGWLRYLLGVNDQLEAFEISPDPNASALQEMMKDMEPGKPADEEAVRSILSNEKIFGLDLCEIGMDKKVIDYLNSMLEGRGAVRKTLHAAVNQ